MSPVANPSADVPAVRRRSRVRLIAGFAFVAITLAACALLGKRFTHTSWPLQRAHMDLVGGAVACYFLSYIFRALGWQALSRLGPPGSRPLPRAARRGRGESRAALPARSRPDRNPDRMRGVKLGLEAIALSIISLGLVDAVAFLPLSISATAASSSSFRWPLLLVVLFGIGSCGILVAGQHLVRIPFIANRARLKTLARRAADHPRSTTREAVIAWFFLLGCWTSRALGSTLLLAALGVGFSPTLALVVLCLSAAASLIPIASGGAVANVGATAAVLLALGVHSEQAINFGLASGILLCGTAAAAGSLDWRPRSPPGFALARSPPRSSRI